MMLLCLYLRKLVYSEQILVNTHGVFGSLKKKVMNSIVIYKKKYEFDFKHPLSFALHQLLCFFLPFLFVFYDKIAIFAVACLHCI